MQKIGIESLKGTVIEHKKYGPCEVLEITNPSEGKFIGKVLASNEEKRFILSKQFFKNVDDYDTFDVKTKHPVIKKRVYKKVDLTKYRNHPLVKEIDGRESKIRKLLAQDQDEEEQKSDSE